MEETPPRTRRKKKTHEASSSKTSKNSRFTTAENTTEDSFECSGKHCQSCTAALIADCVAVCCCPLAVVSLLALAFVKVPYMVGRRCLGLEKRREKKIKYCKTSESLSDDESMVGRDSNESGKEREGKSDIVFEFGGEEEGGERKSICAGFEAENFFLELYQVGQLGFGRVSFTGIQPFVIEAVPIGRAFSLHVQIH
ncbi:hypothetical protein Ancab_004019 [Ancistrocladus abbreviatus]